MAASEHAELHALARAPTPPEPTWRTWWSLVKGAVSSWSDDYAPSMGAALSYYTVFSLAPLLLIVVSVAGLVFGEEAVRGELFAQLQGLMGADAAQAVQSLLQSVSQPEQGIVGTIVGVAVLVFGATTVFGELQDALDRIWRAPKRPNASGLWSLARARLLSFGLILGLAFLLMVSLVMGAVISALGKWWGPLFGGWEILAQAVNLVVGFALTTVVFAMIYKLMPRVRVHWHDVWLGAIVTAVLFTVGKFLIGLYIGKSGIASGFGAAGSVIVVFVWVYYSAQIFLVGAEFTWVYAKTLGSRRAVDPLRTGDVGHDVKATPSRSAPAVAPSATDTSQAAARVKGAAPPTSSATDVSQAAARVRGAAPPTSSATDVSHAAARVAAAPPASDAADSSPSPAFVGQTRGASTRQTSVGALGAGLLFVLTLRFIVPRLLRRH